MKILGKLREMLICFEEEVNIDTFSFTMGLYTDKPVVTWDSMIQTHI